MNNTGHVNVRTLEHQFGDFADATAQTIAELREEVAAVRAQAAKSAETLESIPDDLAALETAIDYRSEELLNAIVIRSATLRRGFWGRLNWLVTGR